MKNKKHHLVAKVQKSNRKIVETEAKMVVEEHIYMYTTPHFLGLVQAQQYTVAGLISFLCLPS